jgi:hypothetical protein
MGAPVVEHAAGPDLLGRRQVVEAVADQQRRRRLDPQGVQVGHQVLGLAAAPRHPQPIHPQEVAVDPQPLDQRHQVLVAPHRQQRLAQPGRLRRRQRLPGVGGQLQALHPAGIAGVVGLVQGLPFPGLDLPPRHLLVEPLHRPGVVGPEGVGVDGAQPQQGQGVVDGGHHRDVVVDQGAVPVPHHVPPHGGQCRATPEPGTGGASPVPRVMGRSAGRAAVGWAVAARAVGRARVGWHGGHSSPRAGEGGRSSSAHHQLAAVAVVASGQDTSGRRSSNRLQG